MAGNRENGEMAKTGMDNEVDTLIAKMRKRSILYSDRGQHFQSGWDSVN